MVDSCVFFNQTDQADIKDDDTSIGSCLMMNIAFVLTQLVSASEWIGTVTSAASNITREEVPLQMNSLDVTF